MSKIVGANGKLGIVKHGGVYVYAPVTVINGMVRDEVLELCK